MVRSIALNLLIASVAGGLFVTSVMPINTFVLIAWLAIVTSFFARSSDSRSNRLRDLLTQFLAFSTVTVAAYLAPTKMQHDHFAERVRLPRTELTVADIESIAMTPSQGEFPVRLSMTCDNDTQTKKIRFANTDISLGDFIETVENQTPLRHRFLHCGNAYTILWGYPPSYYMMLRE